MVQGQALRGFHAWSLHAAGLFTDGSHVGLTSVLMVFRHHHHRCVCVPARDARAFVGTCTVSVGNEQVAGSVVATSSRCPWISLTAVEAVRTPSLLMDMRENPLHRGRWSRPKRTCQRPPTKQCCRLQKPSRFDLAQLLVPVTQPLTTSSSRGEMSSTSLTRRFAEVLVATFQSHVAPCYEARIAVWGVGSA